MVRCSNGTDGSNRRIHYSGELAALPAEKRENHGIKSHELNDKRVLPAREQFKGLKSTTRRSKQRDPLEYGRRGKSRPLIREAWRHCWPIINNSRDKNPQLECQDDINQSKKILSGSHAENPTRKALERHKLKLRVKNKTAQKAILASK
jgi:hypothetical protein